MIRTNRYGVYFIFKSMEQGTTFRISVPKYPTADPNYRILAHQRSRFTHYYFFIADVEVIVGEAAALVGEDAIVRVRRRIFRHTDAEGCPLLHALEDEVDTVPVGSDHAAQPPQNIVLD